MWAHQKPGMWGSGQKLLERDIYAIQKEILQMKDIQEQLAGSWDIDHEEHLLMMSRVNFLADKVRDADRRVFLVTVLAVCLALDRLRMYFW